MMISGLGLLFVSLVSLGTRKKPARTLRTMILVYAPFAIAFAGLVLAFRP